MSINLQEILTQAEKLTEAIEAKSWHHAANAAHACLCAMPSPAWAESEPGLAKYGPGEASLNDWLNMLRRYVLQASLAFVDPDRSWEATDPWPTPYGLRRILAKLTGRPVIVPIAPILELPRSPQGAEFLNPPS